MSVCYPENELFFADNCRLCTEDEANVFVKPDEQSKFTCTLPWREKVGEAKEADLRQNKGCQASPFTGYEL